MVVGDRQMAVFDDTAPWEEKLLLYPSQVDWVGGKVPIARKAEAIPVPLEAVEPLRAECEAFVRAIASREAPLTDGGSGLNVLRVLAAGQRSLDRGGEPVTLERSEPVGFFAHATATIDEGARIGAGTRIWHYAHVMGGSRIGKDCVLGQNTFVGADVRIGHGVKIQNNVSLYDGVELEDFVFCGPSVVFTNVMNPRSEIERKSEFRRTSVRTGRDARGEQHDRLWHHDRALRVRGRGRGRDGRRARPCVGGGGSRPTGGMDVRMRRAAPRCRRAALPVPRAAGRSGSTRTG